MFSLRLVFWLQEPSEPVYTLGTKAQRQAMSEIFRKQTSVRMIPVSRGGSITYHGPGQLVGYLLLDLKKKGISPADFVEKMEASLKDAMIALGAKDASINHERAADGRQYGIWIGSDKLVAIGLRFHKMRYSLHGFAININPDLKYFEQIFGCGLRDKGSISLQRMLRFAPKMQAVKDIVADCLRKAFVYDKIIMERQQKAL